MGISKWLQSIYPWDSLVYGGMLALSVWVVFESFGTPAIWFFIAGMGYITLLTMIFVGLYLRDLRQRGRRK